MSRRSVEFGGLRTLSKRDIVEININDEWTGYFICRSKDDVYYILDKDYEYMNNGYDTLEDAKEDLIKFL